MRINTIWLLKTLRRHIRLAESRSVTYRQNKAARLIIYLMAAFAVIYLISVAITLALAANESDTFTACEFFGIAAPLLLFLDFMFRFAFQHTPAQLTRPYSLLPIPKYACVKAFIISSVVAPYNLIWLAVTIPYTLMTTLFTVGPSPSAGIIISFQLMVAVNCLWYMLVRALVNKNILWWLLPVSMYALAVLIPVLYGGIGNVFAFYSHIGQGMASWHPSVYLPVIIIFLALFEANKHLQYRLTYDENVGAQDFKYKNRPSLGFLGRYGETGEYIRLEIISLMRNKNVRKPFVIGTSAIIIISLYSTLSDIYLGEFMRLFWLVYAFIVYGAVSLIKVMSAEGNYIDCLAVRKENIMQLLRAKYYFYCLMLSIPLILMLPAAVISKYRFIELFSVLCFTAGPVYCLLMQMAVYNRQAMPLNAKFTDKSHAGTNYLQTIVGLSALSLPAVVMPSAYSLLGETATSVLMIVAGIVVIITNKLWIRNIYLRYMKRRYVNMEGFRSTK